MNEASEDMAEEIVDLVEQRLREFGDYLLDRDDPGEAVDTRKYAHIMVASLIGRLMSVGKEWDHVGAQVCASGQSLAKAAMVLNAARGGEDAQASSEDLRRP